MPTRRAVEGQAKDSDRTGQTESHWPRSVVALMAWMSLAVWASVGRAADAESLEADFSSHVKPLLSLHCERCHNANDLVSGIGVEHLTADVQDRDLKLWEAIRHQVASGAMPPDDEPQPSDDQRARIGQWVNDAITVVRSRPAEKNGVTRRLTVAQYANTLRELLMIGDDLTAVIPPDAVSRDGFVNNQETLSLSPLLLEAYFDIAQHLLDRSLVVADSKPTVQNFRVDLGAAINPQPCPDQLILGADSLLLDNADFVVTESAPPKSFAFEPFAMQRKFRFIEGYVGNDTIRQWRDFDSIYHAVFACMRGAHGYPKGRPYSTVPQGLLLRPAIPSNEIFGVDSTYGPKANFKISLRELPDEGNFRVTVTAAKYDDGLLLDPGAASMDGTGDRSIVCHEPSLDIQTVSIPEAGIYQVDVHAVDGSGQPIVPDGSNELTLNLGDRQFVGKLTQPAFLLVRLPGGDLSVRARLDGTARLSRLVFTPLPAGHESATRFANFESRSPRVGVHLGLRRDCGSTLNQVGQPQTVSDTELTRFVFEGTIRNFPSPDVEKDNVNYLAGVREIGVRSEYTDGRDMPRLLIRSVEFEGPYYDSWPPESHRNIFVPSESQDDPRTYARQVIAEFATRAFRRPIGAEEEAALAAVFDDSFDRGATFQDSVKDALMVVLTSPQFLFLIEDSKTVQPEPVDDFELASKLSYFLWNGPPDDKTLRLAETGKIRDELDAEIDRLLDDQRSLRFTTEFVSQWLGLDKFAVLEPDRDRFPKLDQATRSHLAQEPIAFLHHLFRHNLPVRSLIDSDFIVANEVVAGYYDLGHLAECGFGFVAIPHDRPELGGLLSQAAIMAGLSDGRESNPIKRGAWLARRIVAEPPDDPPPNVPTLKEDRDLPLRERLEQHRNQPGCVQCHTKIDPWGIPLEQFDADGRLKPHAVDARSTLPDQTEVAGFDDLKRYLADDRIDQVAFSVLKHLTTYAIGRSLTYSEMETLRQDGLSLGDNGYRMRDMIRYVVRSPMFLEK